MSCWINQRNKQKNRSPSVGSSKRVGSELRLHCQLAILSHHSWRYSAGILPKNDDLFTDNAVESENKVSDRLIHLVRRDLAVTITSLVVIVALVAAFQNGAMPVLDKVLPLVMLAFGFFFGHRAGRL